jgi:NADH-quinone oxidoreductase subunit N
MTSDLLLILPQIIVLLTGIGSLIAEMAGSPRSSLWILIVGMGAATGDALFKLGLHTTAFSKTFRVDDLSLWAVIILCITILLVGLMACSELKDTYREGTVYSLLIFSALGAMLLAGSGDIMFVVLGILITTLSGTALIAYAKTDTATEGGMKYFIFGSVTSAIMIFGLTFWAGITGATYISALHNTGLSILPVIFGFAGLLVGIGYAASLVPFHFWTPDAFEAAPVSVAAYLSVVPKIGALYALAQIARNLPVELINWPLILAIVSLFSMTFGNVAALWQTNVIRLLAYSTIAQAGYFLLAIIDIQHGILGLNALIVFGIAYAVMNTGAFAIAQIQGNSLHDFAGLGKKHPWQAVAMTFFLLSLVGVPPLVGFAGKFLLFGAALDYGYTWLVIIAIINSVISLAVYLRIIVPIFFHKAKKEKIRPVKAGVTFVWIITFASTIILGLGYQWFL